MKNSILSNRYAKALYDFALEKDNVNEVYSDLKLFYDTLKDNRELQVLLRNPVVASNQKHEIFKSIFNGTLHETTYRFLSVLLMKKREPALDTICEEFFKKYNEVNNIREVKITTAQPLSDELRGKIVKMLEEQTKATIELQQVVDPEILGGFKIQMDDYYLDSSIITKINKLKQEFSQNKFQVHF